MNSTDDGMQIDESDEHHRNAFFSIRETLQPASNLTLATNPFLQQQRQPKDSIPSGMTIDSHGPKNWRIEVHSKLTRKLSLILKLKLPSSIPMSFTFL
jgi:hypothetical protein